MPYSYREIKAEHDINKTRLAMVDDGHFPVGMTDCEVVGINGDCGPTCPVWLRGECESDDEEFLAEMEVARCQ